MSLTVSPVNRRVPVSISKRTTPKDQMSARLSTGLPRACSGLMYAANDAVLVRVFEPVLDLLRDGDRLIHGNRASLQALREVLTGHHLHGEEVSGRSIGKAGGFKAVNVGDVGMGERSKNLGFPLEPGQPVRLGSHGRGQNLDGDITIEGGIPAAIHLAHPARTDGRGDFVGSETGTGGKRHEFPESSRVLHARGGPSRIAPGSAELQLESARSLDLGHRPVTVCILSKRRCPPYWIPGLI